MPSSSFAWFILVQFKEESNNGQLFELKYSPCERKAVSSFAWGLLTMPCSTTVSSRCDLWSSSHHNWVKYANSNHVLDQTIDLRSSAMGYLNNHTAQVASRLCLELGSLSIASLLRFLLQQQALATIGSSIPLKLCFNYQQQLELFESERPIETRERAR